MGMCGATSTGWQPANALLSISVTLFGMVTLARLVQFWKTVSSILVMPSRIVTLVSPVQYWNAYLQMPTNMLAAYGFDALDVV